jgi:hypothetical protein
MLNFSDIPQGSEWALYALSSPITYVPEPATVSLVVAGLLSLGAVRLFRCRAGS